MARDACTRTADRLDGYLDGTLGADERREVEAHVAACSACHQLLEAARESAAALRSTAAGKAAGPADPGDDLVNGVLAQTTGPACPRAESLLPDRSAATLVGMDAELLTAHLEHCRPCRQLAATLDWLLPLLPQLAELEPDPATAAAILERTRPMVQRRARRRRVAGLVARAQGRLTASWQSWWQRPRFALEAAYVAMLLIVALMGTPISPLRSVPGQALEVVRAGPTSIFQGDFSATLPGRVITFGAGVFSAVGEGVSGSVDGVRGNLDRRGTAATPAWERLSRHAAAAAERGRAGAWPEALQEIGSAGSALGDVWRYWWRSTAPEDSQGDVNDEGGGA